jgi:hypothetical protein
LRLGERPRRLLAILGVALWVGASFMPIFGGAAEHAYRCRGRTFTGGFDECFNDMLPVELLVPLLALPFAWPFARFAFSLYAPAPAARSRRWRLATKSGPETLWPTLHVLAALGFLWCLWRLLSYPLAAELLRFHLFWAVFGFWFLGGIAAALPGHRSG